MSEIDDYLAQLDDAQREVLRPYFDRARELAPDGEPGLSYGLAAWMVAGKAVVSVAATKKGFSLYPFSGKVLNAVLSVADGIERTPGSVHFTAAHPLPLEIFDRIVAARLAQIDARR